MQKDIDPTEVVYPGEDFFHKMPSGAVRSRDADNGRYDLICPTALQRLAATYAEGFAKYGADNWTKGMPIGETLNHVIRHIELWRGGDLTEDHLAHAAWGLFAVIHFVSKCKCHQQRELTNEADKIYIKECARGQK